MTMWHKDLYGEVGEKDIPIPDEKASHHHHRIITQYSTSRREHQWNLSDEDVMKDLLYLPSSRNLQSGEQKRIHDVREGCRILMVDYERCYYDAGKSFRDGLWKGYFAKCDYLEEVTTKPLRMDRKRENWLAQGFEGDYLEAREKAEAHRDDLRIAVAKDLAAIALAQEKIKRKERDEKKRNRER